MNPLPDRIAAAIDAYGQDRAHDGDCASRDALIALFAELVAERDRYHSALVARHGGEPLALLSELDEARAERDALRADRDAALLILPAACGSLADAADTLRQERDAARAEAKSLRADLCEIAEGTGCNVPDRAEAKRRIIALAAELAAVKRQRDAKDEALRWASELIRGQVTDTVAEVEGLRLGPNMVAAKLAEALSASQPAQRPKPLDGDKCEGGHDAIGIAFTADDVWLCQECLDGCDVEPAPAQQPKPVPWPHMPEVERPDSEVQP